MHSGSYSNACAGFLSDMHPGLCSDIRHSGHPGLCSDNRNSTAGYSKSILKHALTAVILICCVLLRLTPDRTFTAAYAADKRRTAEIYDLESKLVYTYKMKQNEAYSDIREYLSDLKEADPDTGSAWEQIMNYWSYVNEDMTVNQDVLPDGLPTDDSLCIVVLGYQLNPDGSMADELTGRCETALKSAEKYPNAFIAVTGGGTAYKANTTEAAQMASWFAEHGIAPDRIISESQSMTTGENAQFTCGIILENYPQIKSVAVVSSDYHVPLGCLLFREQFLLSALYNDTYPVDVISNAGYTTGLEYYSGISGVKSQASYVWNLADSF